MWTERLVDRSVKTSRRAERQAYGRSGALHFVRQQLISNVGARSKYGRKEKEEMKGETTMARET